MEKLPDLMSNFNQIVLQEFVIEKFFICFDMPLSILNKYQAQSINDLERYLKAESLQQTIEKHKSTGKSSEFTSQGTPVLNLLNEFKLMQINQNNDKIEETKEECVINLENAVFRTMQNQSENAQTQNNTQTSSTSHTSGLTHLLTN